MMRSGAPRALGLVVEVVDAGIASYALHRWDVLMQEFRRLHQYIVVSRKYQKVSRLSDHDAPMLLSPFCHTIDMA